MFKICNRRVLEERQQIDEFVQKDNGNSPIALQFFSEYSDVNEDFSEEIPLLNAHQQTQIIFF